MIPENYIREWKEYAPWKTAGMVEQDLIISRSLVSLFSKPFLAERLAFRGGTALHKLHLAPASRYSEDIDLVQIITGPIGPVFDALRAALIGFLGEPRRKQGPGIVSLVYRIAGASPSAPTLRLKIEINSREHFSILEPEFRPFQVSSRWFSGDCNIRTFRLEELLGTKLRALYQRRKGRDLFDLWLGLSRGQANPERVAVCFHRYMEASGQTITARQFQMNMESKLAHPDFIHDTDDLLLPGTEYDVMAGYSSVERELIGQLDAARGK